MKNIINFIVRLTMITAIVSLFIVGCKKDDDPARDITYDLKVEDVLGVSGIATITEYNSGAVSIDIMLNNVPSGSFQATLCQNSAVEKGTAVITLNPVDQNGKSSTKITTMTYNQLINFDGHIKVIKSANPEVILALGDIGGNEITSIKTVYTLSAVGSYNVTGFATFEKRVNENTLVTIDLSGTIEGASYPATINLSSIATLGGGPVVKTLNNVEGTSGKSYTNIRKLNNEMSITYNNWLEYQGYINIYQNSVHLDNIICQGNIGSN